MRCSPSVDFGRGWPIGEVTVERSFNWRAYPHWRMKAVHLRNDFDSVSLRRLAKIVGGPGTRPRAVVCWRWPRSTMVAAGRMRRGSAASVCRSFATEGCCASTPADRTGWSMGSHPTVGAPVLLRSLGQAPGLVSTPSSVPPDHRRALGGRLLTAGPVPAVDDRRALAAQGPGEPVALGDVRHLARRDHGRARVVPRRSASPRSRRGRATTRKTSWPSIGFDAVKHLVLCRIEKRRHA